MLTIRHHRLVGDGVARRDTPNIGGALRARYLVLHYTAGSSAAGAIDALCTRKPSGNASAHLVLARDGRITQLAPFNVVTWHAGISNWMGLEGLNQHAIGIEMDNAGLLTQGQDGAYRAWFGRAYPPSDVVLAAHKQGGPVQPWHRYTEVQIARSLELAELLVAEYGLQDVLGHDDIAPGRKRDPGPAFPLAAVAAQVLGRGEDSAPRLVVGVNGLNIRSGPGVGHPTVAAPLAKGTGLRLLEAGAHWALVAVEGAGDLIGWVATTFVSAATPALAPGRVGAARGTGESQVQPTLAAAAAPRPDSAEAVADYIDALDLPTAPRKRTRRVGTGAAAPLPADAGAPLVAVGAQLTEWGEGLTSSQRAAVADCLLLAQLSANKVTPPEAGLMAWYRQYLTVLQNLGWLQSRMVFQDRTVADFEGSVHQAVLPVLTAMLGPALAASSLAVAVLRGLQDMDPHSPWLTLFHRASTHAQGAAFQLGRVDAVDGSVTVQLAAVAVDSQRQLTQVLFFKLASAAAHLSVADGQLTMPAERLQALAPRVAEKVAPYLADSVADIPI